MADTEGVKGNGIGIIQPPQARACGETTTKRSKRKGNKDGEEEKAHRGRWAKWKE